MLVRLYTDGACSRNPGPGGWAVICCMPDGTVELHDGKKDTTNNEMELTAINKALWKVASMVSQGEASKSDAFEILSDSAYVVNAINGGWIQKWQRCNWLTSKGDPVKNRQLWESVVVVMRQLKAMKVNVKFTKVRGHSNNAFNDRADQLARSESVKYGQ